MSDDEYDAIITAGFSHSLAMLRLASGPAGWFLGRFMPRTGFPTRLKHILTLSRVAWLSSSSRVHSVNALSLPL